MSRRRRIVRRVLIGLLGLLAVTAYVVLAHTSWFATRLVTLGGGSPTLREAPPVASNVQWHGDYFAVVQIDPQTYAIGAPPYPPRAMSYLIVGEERAVLVDTGPGLRNIRPVAEALTALPITATPTHLHYDHVGSLHRFDRVAALDHPTLRAQTDDGGLLTPTPDQHLGGVDDQPIRAFTVTEWWRAGQVVDLGGRRLEVFNTPGHTPGSMMLYDVDREQLFTGDFIHPGQLLALFPGAHMGAYLATSQRLLERLPADVVLFPGHLDIKSPTWSLDTLSRSDLDDLQRTLVDIRDGTAAMSDWLPPRWRINDRIRLTTTYRWNMRWARR